MRHALGIALVVLAAGSARADRREIVNADPAHGREAEHRVEV